MNDFNNQLTHTGGHMKPDPYNSISRLAAEHGIEAAREVAEFEASHVTTIKDVVDREGIECEYVVTNAIDVQLNADHCKTMKANYDHLVHEGCRPTQDTEFVAKPGAEQRSGVIGAEGCFIYPAGHMWPYKFVLHLLRRALASGHVTLHTHTPVVNVERSTKSYSSHSWIVNTPRGRVAARKVVYATNGYTPSLLPQYRDAIVPVRGTCSRIVVPKNSGAPRLTSTYTIRWNTWDYDYLVPREDGSIVVGGARSSFVHRLGDWYNVTDDGQVLESAAKYFDGYMQRTFSGWEDSGAYTDRVWTGIMGYSMDGLPHVGAVPGTQGKFIMAGFTGHGMPQIFLSAAGLAQMVLNDISFEQTKLPRLFKARAERLFRREENRHLDALNLTSRESETRARL
ncbi:hypothetical protein LTS17_011252 [Exophiala oligosperma]